jgi:HAD superfamily hydrolase (TIGR01549 family)
VLRVRAVLFDLDSTLVDNSGLAAAIRATCVEVATALPGLDPERVLEANGEVWQRYWPTVVEAWTLGRLGTEALSTEAWRQTLSQCGCEDPQLPRAAREIHSRHEKASVRPFPDAIEVLDALRGRCLLGLVTNAASDRQRAVLESLGIGQYFDAIAISGEVGVAKPDPSILQRVMRQLKVEPQHAWYVGDDPSTDIACAHAAGVTAVWLNRDGRLWDVEASRPHYEISSLAELPALLRVTEPDGSAARSDNP